MRLHAHMFIKNNSHYASTPPKPSVSLDYLPLPGFPPLLARPIERAYLYLATRETFPHRGDATCVGCDEQILIRGRSFACSGLNDGLWGRTWLGMLGSCNDVWHCSSYVVVHFKKSKEKSLCFGNIVLKLQYFNLSSFLLGRRATEDQTCNWNATVVGCIAMSWKINTEFPLPTLLYSGYSVKLKTISFIVIVLLKNR